MCDDNSRGKADADLRARAENKALENAASGAPVNLDELSPGETKRLLHELRVHQIELEMQNEELRRAQAELEASRARYFDLYDLAPVGYVTISEKGLILEANLTAAGLLGMSRSSLLKKPLTGFILSEDQDIYYRHRKELFETGDPQVCEIRIAGKNRDFFWARIHAIVAHEADGAQVCRAALSDITEQKNHEDARRKYLEQDKMAAIGQLAGRMAHDFNNVLTIILGTSELLLTQDLPPDVKSDVETILETANRGGGLARNLLFFAKDQQLKLSRFSLNDKIDMIIKTLRGNLKNIDVVVDYGAGLDGVIADAGLLENALINLINNATQAMSKTEKPVLRIKTRAENNIIRIELADNGCGIPREWKDKMFDPLFSLKGSGDMTGAYPPDVKGTGYGLSNVKRCMDKHGGTVECESEADKGAIFRITLPIITEAARGDRKAVASENKDAKGKNVLVVEDEPQLGRILCLLLEKLGHYPTLAVDAKTALERHGMNSFDAISLDFVLPDMNGMEVYERIRETDSEIPIIFVSGNFEYLQSMMELETRDPKMDHLAKPFSNMEYISMIQKWLT